jgi:DNA-binding NarL/FixJ family response regulator
MGVVSELPQKEAIQALPGFLTLLGQAQQADEILPSLIDGPLGPYGTTAIWFAARTPEGLVLQASCGFPAAMVGRYRLIRVELDGPGPMSLRLGEVLSLPLDQVLFDFPELQIDAHLWEQLIEGSPANSWLISVPIAHQARNIGIYAFIARGLGSWQMSDSHVLLGIGAALGLWLAGTSASAVALDSAANSQWFTEEQPLLITPRQKDILLLVERGKSNASIAASLGYSASTIKIELRRIMRNLRVTERAAAVNTARKLGLLTETPLR